MHGYDGIARKNKGQRGVLRVLTGFGYVLLTVVYIMLPGLTRLWWLPQGQRASWAWSMISSVIRPSPNLTLTPHPPSLSSERRTRWAKSVLCARNPEVSPNAPTLDKQSCRVCLQSFPNPLMRAALRPIYSQGDICECIFNNHPLVMREGMYVSVMCSWTCLLVCFLVFSFTLSPSLFLLIVFLLDYAISDSLHKKRRTKFHSEHFKSRYWCSG